MSRLKEAAKAATFVAVMLGLLFGAIGAAAVQAPERNGSCEQVSCSYE